MTACTAVLLPDGAVRCSGRLARATVRLERGSGGREMLRRIRSQLPLNPGVRGLFVSEARLAGLEETGGVTYFRVEVTGTAGLVWQVRRRYNQFLSLRDALGVREQRVGSVFPGKTFLWKCEGDALAERQLFLERWLAGLVREFATGGDGRNSLIPLFRERKLGQLHRFLGVAKDGRLLSDVQVPEVVNPLFVPPLSSQAFYTGPPGENEAEAPASTGPGVTYSVAVPDGVMAGEQLQVEVDGVAYAIAVPTEHTGELEFRLPAAPAAL